jgi:hypothetical protein
MNFRILLGASLSALLFASSICLAAGSAGAYRIDMTISLNGSLVGKPAVVAEPGAEAEVRSEKAGKPDDGFRILVKASPLSDAPDGKESIKLELAFFGRFDGKWVERARHSVTALVGKNVSFAFPSESPEPKGKDYDVVLTTSQVTAAAPAR